MRSLGSTTGSGVVVLTDMFGGTPSNLAISVMDKASVEVIAGVNLPLTGKPLMHDDPVTPDVALEGLTEQDVLVLSLTGAHPMERFPKSLISFQRMFPDEAACAAWLFSMRWPEGFQCPGCGHDHGWALRAKAHTFECTSCHRQTSVTAGTILHGSKLDLTVWFWAAYLMATHSNGISALQLQKQLALGSYRTAWMLAAKLRRATVDPDRNPLSGLVEIDETSLPFRTKNDPASGGPGRSHDGKLLVVGGIEVGDGNKPGRLRLAALTDYGAGSLNAFIARNIAPASTAKTDGWAGYAGVPVDQHDPHVIGAMAAHLVLPWIHQMFSNLKGWARGVYHGLRRKYLQTYLDEFVFRFNRRRTRHPTFRSMFAIAIRTKPLMHDDPVTPDVALEGLTEQDVLVLSLTGARPMERFPKSLISFQRMFPDEAACAAWLFSMRWPEGFQCPGCGHDHGWALRAKAHTFECTSCHRQTSVTAGTILHGSKLDLTVWFWAAYLMATHSNGISALQLQKQLALGSYRTAWMLAAKLRRAMVDPDRNPLSGLVEIDETSLPFRTKNDPASGGPGRSHDGKLLVVGGIEVGDGNKPGRLRLAALTDYGAGSLNAFIARNIAPASTAKTDGWAGYAGVPVDQHDPHVIGAMAAHLVLPWIHQMFSNLKGWARGVYHGLRRKYLQTYLDEFVFRFNRRRTRHPTFRSMFAIAIRTKPVTCNMLVAPEQSA